MALDTAGNLGLGVTPSAWSGFNAFDVSNIGSIAGYPSYGLAVMRNAYYNGTNYIYKTTNPASYYDQDASRHAWFNAPSGTAGNTVTFTQAMTLNASGGLQTLNTISVGNATPSTNGAGITFPATQSASTDANTLDDYEEGTFTPTLVGFSTAGATTYSTQTGLYTKIGRQVTYIVNLVVTATTGTGAALLGGFPFTFNSTVIPVAAMDASALNWTGGTYLIVMPEENTTTAFIFGEADDASRTTQNLTNETQVIRFVLTHFV
jgi:hypothetical protein